MLACSCLGSMPVVQLIGEWDPLFRATVMRCLLRNARLDCRCFEIGEKRCAMRVYADVVVGRMLVGVQTWENSVSTARVLLLSCSNFVTLAVRRACLIDP